MGRRDSLSARSVAETCLHVWTATGGSHFSGCPFYKECPRGHDVPDESCFEAVLAWLDEADPASELGPGELKAVEKRTPEGYLDHSDLKEAADKIIEIVSEGDPVPVTTREEDDAALALLHYSELLQKLAEAVPLPGSPTLAECVDKAIEIIKEWKTNRLPTPPKGHVIKEGEFRRKHR